PQIIIRQLLRYASVPSCSSLTMSRQSSNVASSGALISNSWSSRSPDRELKRQIFSPTCIWAILAAAEERPVRLGLVTRSGDEEDAPPDDGAVVHHPQRGARGPSHVLETP